MKMLTFTLLPLPPFRLDFTAWVVRRRPHNIIDRWDSKQYTRILLINNTPVKVVVYQSGTYARPVVHVTASGKWEAPDSTARSLVKKYLEKVLGLKRDLQEFYELACNDKLLLPLVERFKGVKPPQFPSIFEALINALACQQLSLHVGIILLNRLTQAYGPPFKDGKTTLFAFPRPEDLNRAKSEDLRRLGFSFHKSNAIIELSRRLIDGELDLCKLDMMDDDGVRRHLEGIRGIGRWSFEYVMLRGLGRIHQFPGDDVGARTNLQKLLNIRKGLDYEGLKKITGQWHPYAGLVYFHLLLRNLEKQGCL